jgi:hypothetical protein
VVTVRRAFGAKKTRIFVRGISSLLKLKNIDALMLTRVWQELEYRIDVCRVTRGAHIENLQLSKKTFSVFLWL